MKIFRVERSKYNGCDGCHSWLVKQVFSTEEKAWEWIKDNKTSYTQQRVIEQEVE